MNVVIVSPADLPLLDDAYQAIISGYSDAYRCSTAHDVPDLAWLRVCVLESPPLHEVLVARDGDTVVGLAVLHLPTGLFPWLSYNTGQSHSYGELAAAVYDATDGRRIIATFRSDNPRLHAELCEHGFVLDEHLRIHYRSKGP